ncbi:MAG: hypothetical protein V3R99_04805 [Thermoguttaceae bacterium]
MSTSPNKLAESIEAWFRDHNDGEFVALPDDYALAVHGNLRKARTLVYTTKPQCLFPLPEYFSFVEPVTIVGRYGLPLSGDLAQLCEVDTQAARVFIGDADPPDLLVFAWLKSYIPIEWRGISDALLQRLERTDLLSIAIPMSDAEKSTVAVLTTFCPEFRVLLGPQCSALLDRGFKIELEGATLMPNDVARHAD